MSLTVSIRKRLGNFTLDVSFETDDPITGLLGASGSGKSMTLKCIAGVGTPDEGRIVLDGETLFDTAHGVNLPPQRRRVGYLFQHYALFPHMTVKQNILCGMRGEKDRVVRQHRLDEMFDLLQLTGLEKRRPAQLSGGQAQRVALARMLVSRPRLLLLDEPFSALDSYLRDTLQPALKGLLHAYGRQAMLVTHSRDEAYRLCERLCVMDEGRILRADNTKAVFANPGSVPTARLTGCKNIAPAVKASAYQVDVPGWNLRLTTAQPVPDGIRAVGLRAHAFSPDEKQNRFAIERESEIEQPFEWTILFRCAGQDTALPALWWHMPRDKKPAAIPRLLGVSPDDVLLLT